MGQLDHEIKAPEGFPMRWVERDLPGFALYVGIVSILLGLSVLFILFRGWLQTTRAGKELAANPSNRAAIFKKIAKRAVKSDRGHLKVALICMLHSFVITMIDGGIAFFVLAKDVSEHPEIWNKDMVLELALYSVYVFVLFVASFILVPMLQMLAVTWGLTRFVKKGNTLSDYVPQARSCSTIMALLWTTASFCVVCGWPVVGKTDQTTLRFLVLEGVWGSAMAWLEASISFCYLSHAIGDKELKGNNGVGEIVALFAKAATAPFMKSKEAGLPVVEDSEPLLAKQEA